MIEHIRRLLTVSVHLLVFAGALGPVAPAIAETLPLRSPTGQGDVPIYRPSDARPRNILPIPENGIENPDNVVPEKSSPSSVYDRCRTLPGVGEGSNRPIYCKGIRR